MEEQSNGLNFARKPFENFFTREGVWDGRDEGLSERASDEASEASNIVGNLTRREREGTDREGEIGRGFEARILRRLDTEGKGATEGIFCRQEMEGAEWDLEMDETGYEKLRREE